MDIGKAFKKIYLKPSRKLIFEKISKELKTLRLLDRERDLHDRLLSPKRFDTIGWMEKRIEHWEFCSRSRVMPLLEQPRVAQAGLSEQSIRTTGALKFPWNPSIRHFQIQKFFRATIPRIPQPCIHILRSPSLVDTGTALSSGRTRISRPQPLAAASALTRPSHCQVQERVW